MNITKNNVDALNAIVTIELAKEDYQGNVDKVLANYKKTASVPGFRKGAMPMSLIVKQYGKAVLLEEVNKILQDKLNNYLVEEKLDILGNPLPVLNEDFDWDADVLKFDFELGLTPEFAVNLEDVSNIVKYQIVADQAMLDEQVEYIQKQYGKLVSQAAVEENSELLVTVVDEEAGINNETKFAVADIRTKTNQKKFLNKKVGDTLSVSTKGLFEDEQRNLQFTGTQELVELDVVVTIKEINETQKAELNQELFDKLFGEGIVTSVEQLQEKIKEDAEKQFKGQGDQKFLSDVYENLVDSISFDLPATFLKKWLQTAGETTLTPEQAEEEYNKSEKGLRFQLIEGKLMSQYDLQLNFEEIKEHTVKLIKDQLAQFGQADADDKTVEDIVARVMSNQEEVKRISEQVMSEKVLALFNDKVKAEAKEVSYQDFVKEMYGA